MQTSVANDTFFHSTQPLKLAKLSKKFGKKSGKSGKNPEKNPDFLKVVRNGLIQREL